MSRYLQQSIVPIVPSKFHKTQRSLRFPACHHAIEMATAHFGVTFGCTYASRTSRMYVA